MTYILLRFFEPDLCYHYYARCEVCTFRTLMWCENCGCGEVDEDSPCMICTSEGEGEIGWAE
jgi:hypothetical protein